MQKERIKHEPGNSDQWICLCDNRPSDDGFFPCDEKGNEVEPVIGNNWCGLYVCARCGRVIEQETLEVVGINPAPLLLG